MVDMNGKENVNQKKCVNKSIYNRGESETKKLRRIPFKKKTKRGIVGTNHGGHRMTQNRSPSAWLVAILDQTLFLEDWVRIYNASNDGFLVLLRGPSEVGR